jgi:hypothetical protein
MAEVIFKGWKYGLKKIFLTKLLQKHAGLSLKAAKIKTDSLINGEIFSIETKSSEHAKDLMKEATALCADCEIIENND